ncbi:LacI family DNA-binding transcriptional regulator [Enterocloster bolteae]|uniref:LacI family DNA-binding transcriptional regulator n=1 Tax=Enterocloster bolteae TaxID=208479 RepID=UPI00210862F9|nr:LacI family DNA-binding transcriptional regulator [Enterocloster bolteae]MCQ5144546.1 LacI family transcriptional regulator [Enterocloster bolteae]
MSKERPTMVDVANLAGVTQPTVSYVINGTANISDEVKERVNHAIKELNYKPNYLAIALKTNRSRTIGIIIPDITNTYYAVMVSMIEKLLIKEGYTIIINSTDYNKTMEENALKHLLSHNVEGVIITYQFSNQRCWDYLRDSGKSAVVLEGGSKCGEFACINTDNYFGGYTATEALLKQGKKKIAYVSQTSEIEALADRCQGYKDAMRDYGRMGDLLVYHSSGPGDKWKGGAAVGKKIRDADIDGVVVSSDVIAVGILKTILMSGIKVPQDISIIGYDDIPLAELFVPALSTVAQPLEEMCRLTVEKLLQLLAGEPVENSLIKPRLILRETTT